MELAYDLFVTAFTAILLSFLAAKLVSFAVSGADVSGGNGLCTGVDNGDKQRRPTVVGGVEGENLEKRLKVAGLKSKKIRLKKISSDTVLVSEFKGKTESAAVSAKISGGLSEADDVVDDRKKLGYEEKDFGFPERRVEDGYFGVDDPVQNEGLLSSSEKPFSGRVLEEMGFREEIDCSIEGLNLEINQGIDSDRLIGLTERRDCKEKGTEGIEPKKKDTIDDQDEQHCFFTSTKKVNVQIEDNVISGNAGGEMEISDGEEWEGIERNELEKDFVRAINYIECVQKGGRLNKFGSDVIMQFHDLQKIAMDGPCHESKISGRAKWNSWQKLGSMNAEEAMEKYITLLSDKVPGWIDGNPYVESKTSSEMDDIFRSLHTADVDAPLIVPLACRNESKLGEELVTGTGVGDLSVNKDEE